jgi:hypothetical protein
VAGEGRRVEEGQRWGWRRMRAVVGKENVTVFFYFLEEPRRKY